MMPPQKILLILHLPPPFHGASLVGEGISGSSSINNAYSCHYVNLSGAKEFGEIGKFSLSKALSFLSIYWKVTVALVRYHPDLCYATINSKGAGFYKDFVIVLLMKIFRKRIIYHFHNKGVSLYQNRFLDHLLYRIAFRNTFTILTSPLLFPDMEKYLTEEQVFYCPNGIPALNRVTGQKVSRKRCRILFISNMMKAKGVWDLVNACEILKKKGLDFQCDFVGAWVDIDKREFAECINDKLLTDKVFTHGAQYGPARDKFYRNADIFVFPSHNEAFPLVLLEAMAHALPIVSTTVGAIPEIVDPGQTGWLVSKTDAGDLADKIEYLLLNPDQREKFGSQGHRKFIQHYTFDIFEKRMRSIFDEVMSRRR